MVLHRDLTVRVLIFKVADNFFFFNFIETRNVQEWEIGCTVGYLAGSISDDEEESPIMFLGKRHILIMCRLHLLTNTSFVSSLGNA